MIFASDLDQTLIYSKRSSGRDFDEKQLLPVESIRGKAHSFMTKKTLTQLIYFMNKAIFVPVTTRTTEQYRRIRIFQKDLLPEFAIISNGGYILHKGTIDRDWQSQVQRLIRNESVHLKEVQHTFKKISSPEWIKKSQIADNLFLYYIIDRERAPYEALHAFQAWLLNHGWVSSLQKRRLYLMPKALCKGKALQYIKEKKEATNLLAAGDSLLDLPMADASNVFIAAAHGELAEKTKDNRLHFYCK